MTEEKYIAERVGRRNPFVVPEGYFEALTSQVMDSLPERKPRAKTIWMRPWLYAAASICVLIVSATIWLFGSKDGSLNQFEGQMVSENRPQTQQDAGDAFFDDVADYVMLDNQDIYACLSDY